MGVGGLDHERGRCSQAAQSWLKTTFAPPTVRLGALTAGAALLVALVTFLE